MNHTIDWKRAAPCWLAALAIAVPALAAGPGSAGDSDSDEDRILFGSAIRLEDCPRVRVLGTGGARVISLSPRTFLGVEATHLTPELRAHFGVPGDAGVMLSKIVEGSAAEAAGLAVGDIVTRVDDDEISSVGRLGLTVRRKDGGDVVEIEYWRDGERHRATATLQEKERCTVDIGDTLRAIKIEDLPDLGELGVEIGGEELESALKSLNMSFGPLLDIEKHFKGLDEIDLQRIEERMERVQERLERLEQRLEREYGREVERTERELERSRSRAERDRERLRARIELEDERARALAEREAERAERAAELERRRAEREAELAERAELARARGGDGPI